MEAKENEREIDLAIVGDGPAGWSAALNAGIRNKRVVVFGKRSSSMDRAPVIRNSLGHEGKPGRELLSLFQKQVESRASTLSYQQDRVQNVLPMGEKIGLLLSDQRILQSGAVILATGVRHGTPLPGEEQFLGRGVSYCATCDGSLYRGKRLLVVGYSEDSFQEARYLQELAAEIVFVNRTGQEPPDHFPMACIQDAPMTLEGKDRATTLVFANRRLEADGFFFLREALPVDLLAPGLTMEEGHVQVSRLMETNFPGIYAAGDLTGWPYQLSKAIGEGQVAALAACRYLDAKKK